MAMHHHLHLLLERTMRVERADLALTDIFVLNILYNQDRPYSLRGCSV